jgi:hypothetical protein
MRNSHIAILCSLVVLLLISIVLNVLICVRYQKQNNSSIIELFYQMDKKDKVEVEEVAP